jgi:hypothetical protein
MPAPSVTPAASATPAAAKSAPRATGVKKRARKADAADLMAPDFAK